MDDIFGREFHQVGRQGGKYPGPGRGQPDVSQAGDYRKFFCAERSILQGIYQEMGMFRITLVTL